MLHVNTRSAYRRPHSSGSPKLSVRSYSWSCIWLCAVLLTTLVAQRSHAQYAITGNKFVQAEVESFRGLVTIKTTPGGYYGNAGGRLSFQDESFLSVDIDGQIYTNNDGSGLDTAKNFGGYLRFADTKKIGDTIVSMFKLPNGDLYQDVYPVEFDFSGQIILRWRFKSRSNSGMRIQQQYLLDTRIRGNDRAKLLTRFGYRNTWARFTYIPNPNYPTIPSFFQAFEQDLTAANGFNPKLVSQGTFIAPDLGLIRPDAVVVGDWTIMSYWLWGSPKNLPEDQYGDSAILMTFPSVGVLSGQTIELGRTAYGTGEFETCTGDLYGLIYRPRRLKPNAAGDGYTPNPFKVDLYLFNTNPFTEANNTVATLTVGPHLHILDSGAINNRTEQTQPAVPKIVAIEGVSVASWTVEAEKTCDSAFSYLEIKGSSSIANPSFVKPCILPVTFPCLDKDTLAPIADPIVTNGFTKSVEFYDNRAKDKGIQEVYPYNYNLSYFDVRVDPFDPCTKNKVKVTLTQKDSLVGGCVDIRVTDCAGNITNQQVCFPRYPLHPDTIPPRISIITRSGSWDSSICNMKLDSLLAVDDTTYDRGLRSITLRPGVPPVNMELLTEPFAVGAARHGFNVRVIDSLQDGCISIRATDFDGNISDTTICYCTIPDKHAPTVTVFNTSTYSWSVFVEDEQPWDRHIDTISVYNRRNIRLVKDNVTFEPTRQLTRGMGSFGFNIEVIDTMKSAAFCLKAKDLADSLSLDPSAKWWSTEYCSQFDTTEDIWKPTIRLTYVSPTRIKVDVDDIHYQNGTRIGWDKGVDSVWFTNQKGFTIPAVIHAMCTPEISQFEVYVTDSLALDSISTICINAIDCAGNFADRECIRYPIKPDVQPPQIKSTATLPSKLDLIVTDSTTYDRGLHKTYLDKRENFDPFDREQPAEREITLSLSVSRPGKSATGVLTSIDEFGIQSTDPAVREEHTTRVPISVWVQGMQLRPGTLAKENEDFRIPLYFVQTDTFTLARKEITKYHFAYQITGDPGFTFVGVNTDGSASADFDVVPTVVGNRIDIVGTSRTGAPLSDQSLPVLDLVVHADKSEVTRKATITPIDLSATSAIEYNDGAKRVATDFMNYKVELPAPFGSISGGTIVSQGSCTPVATSGQLPTAVSLEPPRPNPTKGVTKVIFSVPEETPTVLSVYNSLGREIMMLVNDVRDQGFYESTFDASKFASGTYYIRLECAGKTVTRTLRLAD